LREKKWRKKDRNFIKSSKVLLKLEFNPKFIYITIIIYYYFSLSFFYLSIFLSLFPDDISDNIVAPEAISCNESGSAPTD